MLIIQNEAKIVKLNNDIVLPDTKIKYYYKIMVRPTSFILSATFTVAILNTQIKLLNLIIKC